VPDYPQNQPHFSPEEIQLAQEICREPDTAGPNLIKRARLLLLLAADASRRSQEYARELGIDARTVRKWRQRWMTETFTLGGIRQKRPLFYGEGLPYTDITDLSGMLIVIEGTDGVGRSTQIERLSTWLEVEGHGVISTGWTRSPLVGRAIDSARRGNTLNPLTLSLLYASDFADRLENQIIPALKGGFIVLADRYMYTAFARHAVRGVDPQWMREIFGFALTPNLVFYLDVDVQTLIPRAMQSEKGLNYWESGMDLNYSESAYESFVEYQTRILAEFDKMKAEFEFITIDASRSTDEVYLALQAAIRKFLPPSNRSMLNAGIVH
jgi:dTMP kinase